MAEGFKDLPDECWELIFDKLGHHSHFEALTLVSKRFLSIINELRTRFTLSGPTVIVRGGNLSRLLNRFPNIKSMNLRRYGHCREYIVDQIAFSCSNIKSLDISEGFPFPLDRCQLLGENLKGLRVLKCSKMWDFSDNALAALTDCLPWLEELDISYPDTFLHRRHFETRTVGEMNVTDDGIEMLSLKLKDLRKINISGNQFLTDRSLRALSSNCALLEEVVVRECPMVTQRGIQFLIRDCPNLRSLLVGEFDFGKSFINFSVRDSLTRARCLSTLDIDKSAVCDEFLYSLAMSAIPLKSFTLSYCSSFTFEGISLLLQKYQSLEYLAFIDVDFLNDSCVTKLSKNLCMLTTIKLKLCSLTESTFFMLSRSCPLLEDIDMGETNLGGGNSTVDFVKNPRIRSLNLTCNPNLSDECLAKLASACPYLEMLDVSSCSDITEIGIANFLKHCSKIRHLEINGCRGIKNIGKGIELPKLEVLGAGRSGIDDEGLAVIGKRCYALLSLDLEGCLGVTTKGLKEMLVECKRLREINLYQCVNVSTEITDWMVFLRQSLRKIVPPCPSVSHKKMGFYLGHGCYVWSPPDDYEKRHRQIFVEGLQDVGFFR